MKGWVLGMGDGGWGKGEKKVAVDTREKERKVRNRGQYIIGRRRRQGGLWRLTG